MNCKCSLKIILFFLISFSLRNTLAADFQFYRLDSLSAQDDSLRNLYQTHPENEDVGLFMNCPKHWYIFNNKEITPSSEESGVVIVDSVTRATMFIILDKEGKDYKAENFPDEFKMNDNTIRAFTGPLINLTNQVRKRYYIFTANKKISIHIISPKKYINEYLSIAEGVIQSIKLTPRHPK